MRKIIAVSLTMSGISLVCADELAQPAEASRFEGYANAPEFTVVPRKDELFFFPCNQCHEAIEPNPDIRALSAPHATDLEHGRGLIWCLSCHDLANRDALRNLLSEEIDFDDAHLVCAGCHASRHKDWTFGVHGKRVDNWEGARTQYSCTHCHDPHRPALQPRAPKPPPPVRAGLERVSGEDLAKPPVWERHEEDPR